jgi:hypothetical protein
MVVPALPLTPPLEAGQFSSRAELERAAICTARALVERGLKDKSQTRVRRLYIAEDEIADCESLVDAIDDFLWTSLYQFNSVYYGPVRRQCAVPLLVFTLTRLLCVCKLNCFCVQNVLVLGLQPSRAADKDMYTRKPFGKSDAGRTINYHDIGEMALPGYG